MEFSATPHQMPHRLSLRAYLATARQTTEQEKSRGAQHVSDFPCGHAREIGTETIQRLRMTLEMLVQKAAQTRISVELHG
jgi:hypothetical protein